MSQQHAAASPAAVGFRSWLASISLRLPRLGGWAPLVYLVTALPTVLFLTVLTPPFQSPDEPNHFQRAVSILNGRIVAQRGAMRGQAGAVIPRSVSRVSGAFMDLSGHPEVKYTTERMRDVSAIHWDRADKGYSDFSNTTIYPPFFYVPTVAALSVSRSLDWTVLNSYRLARSVNGIVAVLLATAAIGVAGHGRSVLFAVLSLPMALHLFASVSQDALLIAGVGLAVALCSRAAARPGERTWPALLVAALLFGAAMAARPPYAALVVALAVPRTSNGGSRLRSLVHRHWPVALALAIGLGWIALGAAPAQVPMRINDGVSIADQLSAVVRHPGLFPSALGNTLRRNFVDHFAQAIGVLGWSDGPLSDAHRAVGGAALVVGALLCSGLRERCPARLWGGMVAVGMVLAFVGLHGALYLSWTPVGADQIDGFQGRYILPILALAAVALPATTARRSDKADARPGRLHVLGWAALFVLTAASDLWLPFAVFDRYYA